MKDNIIDRIGINSTGVYSINARFGVGKTSLACILTSELYLTGKNVLFLTEETSVRTIQRKFYNLIIFKDYMERRLLIKASKDLTKAFAIISPIVRIYDITQPSSKSVEYKTMGMWKKNFITPLSSLTNLTIRIKKPSGEIIKNLNDTLDIKFIYQDKINPNQINQTGSNV